MHNRTQVIHENFTRRVLAGELPAPANGSEYPDGGLGAAGLLDMFESQVMSRLLDLVARRLRARNLSFYTIGSSGHEGNAAFGKAFRATDMAFLHYRSGAFLIQRSKQVAGQDILRDMLLSFVASSEDPVSGGRHKVLGSRELMVPPQTSTIASHLPKAMGAAHAVGLARRLQLADPVVPRDSVVVCSFGDASVNHSTALGALNAAAWAAYQGSPMPIVFICEDNGIGISVRTPPGWIRRNFSARPGLHYLACDGLDLRDSHRAAAEARDIAAREQKPVFLHTRMVRLMGHAGSDIETEYLEIPEIERNEGEDPLLHSARTLLAAGILSAQQICELYRETDRRIEAIAEEVIKRPRLGNAAEIMASIVPSRRVAVPPLPAAADRKRLFTGEERLLTQPQHMARLLNVALADVLLQYPETVVCGEDVAGKGGVYSVTTGLLEKFGPLRVVDTLLDEQSILGLAIGLAHNGFLGIPEIQFLAYVHNAEDQIRGEAATLSFFSRGRFDNPMVVRVAGLAYQKGFGGHFHNDNSIAVFRDIPGLIVACPSHGADAVQLLRSCIRLAHAERRVVIFLEPIALYMTKDLHESGDGLMASIYPPPGAGAELAPGVPGLFGDGTDLCIVTYGNGCYLSRRAVRRLEAEHDLSTRIVDLRWLAPLHGEQILAAIGSSRRILVVDECRRSGSVSEALFTLFVEKGITAPYARITAEDSFIPLGAAAELVLPSVDSIVAAATRLLSQPTSNLN